MSESVTPKRLLDATLVDTTSSQSVSGKNLTSGNTFPTFNQNTTGSAATLTTPRAINGVNFDGSAAITVTAAAGTLTGTTLNSTVVNSSLTSVGTIATGTWQGTAITDTYISSAATWNAKQNAITLTTTGTSGAATLVGSTLNIPNYATGGGGNMNTTTYDPAGIAQQLLGATAVQNVTNKSFTVNSTTFVDLTDASKKLGFGLNGSATGTFGFIVGVFTANRTLTLPDATDTLTGKATTDTFTNKTFDTAGTGNSFKINGTAITANTGTGSNVLATSPTLVTPVLGVATATSINGLTVTTSTGTLTVVNGGTLVTAGAFSQTHTVTAATNSTYPAGTHTLAGLDVAQTWSAVQSFNSSDFVQKGSTSGTITVNAPATAGSNTITWPAATGTVALVQTPQTNFVVTDESTTSTVYSNLTTSQAVTITVGSTGTAFVTWSAGVYNGPPAMRLSVAVSGASTVAANDNWSIRTDSATFVGSQFMSHYFTGLTPGSTTFTLQSKTPSGTMHYFERTITAVAV
jgi:hypothetical protein